MAQKQVVLLGKGDLAIRIGEWQRRLAKARLYRAVRHTFALKALAPVADAALLNGDIPRVRPRGSARTGHRAVRHRPAREEHDGERAIPNDLLRRPRHSVRRPTHSGTALREALEFVVSVSSVAARS